MVNVTVLTTGTGSTGNILRVTCASCKRPTKHVVKAAYKQRFDWGEIQEDRLYQIVACEGCEEVSLRYFLQSSEDFTVDEQTGKTVYLGTEELYPPRLEGRSVLADDHFLPPQVRDIYKETLKALQAEQRILAGIGIRALIEAVCAHKEAKGSNLEKRIDWLAAEGVLAKPGAEILHKLRVIGNEAAHEVRASRDHELSTAFDVIEHLLQGVYLLPAKSNLLDRKKSPWGAA
jgi:hypothetical protein